MIDALRAGLDSMQIAYAPQALAQLEAYFSLLLQANATMNLTAITDPDEAVPLHFLDSASLLRQPWLQPGMRCVDVGAGAGFPGLVLAILRPDASFTLMDALRKRVDFLSRTAEQLGLRNVRALHLRAEDAGRQKAHREQYDMALARAVASLPILCEYCLPLLRLGGQMVAYKGPQGREEALQAQRAYRVLGAEPPSLHDALVPGRQHVLIHAVKRKPTPAKYPRKAGLPQRQPLV